MEGASKPHVSFEVEKVIGVSIGKGNVRTYQVQFSPAWMSSFHLVGCEHLIQEFLQQQSAYVPQTTHTNEKTTSTTTATTTNATTTADDVCALSVDQSEINGDTNSAIEVSFARPYDRSSDVEAMSMQSDAGPSSDPLDNIISGIKSFDEEQPNESPSHIHHVIKIEDEEVEEETKVSNADESTDFMDTYHDEASYSYAIQEPLGFENLQTSCSLTISGYDSQTLSNSAGSARDCKPQEQGDRDKPFTCTICHASFKTSNYLKLHHQTHSRPYKCTFCGKTFSQSGNLKSHMRTHTGEKPFACNVCTKTFNRNDQLKNHMKAHQGCNVCGQSFTSVLQYTKHVKLCFSDSSIS